MEGKGSSVLGEPTQQGDRLLMPFQLSGLQTEPRCLSPLLEAQGVWGPPCSSFPTAPKAARDGRAKGTALAVQQVLSALPPILPPSGQGALRSSCCTAGDAEDRQGWGSRSLGWLPQRAGWSGGGGLLPGDGRGGPSPAASSYHSICPPSPHGRAP